MKSSVTGFRPAIITTSALPSEMLASSGGSGCRYHFRHCEGFFTTREGLVSFPGAQVGDQFGVSDNEVRTGGSEYVSARVIPVGTPLGLIARPSPVFFNTGWMVTAHASRERILTSPYPIHTFAWLVALPCPWPAWATMTQESVRHGLRPEPATSVTWFRVGCCVSHPPSLSMTMRPSSSSLPASPVVNGNTLGRASGRCGMVLVKHGEYDRTTFSWWSL
jgi:hypothetical protein